MKMTWSGVGAPLVAGLLVHAMAAAPAAQADIVNVTTPGVYIQEIDDFGPTVTGAPALQVMIGDVSVSGGVALIASSVSDFTVATSSASPAVTQAVADYFANGGDRLAVVGAASADAEDLMAALDSLSVDGALDLFLPELRGLGDGEWQEVAARLVAAAGERNAMAWLDPPADAVGHGATPTFADPGGVAALGRQLRSTVGVGAEQVVLLNGGVVDAAGIARAASPGVLGLRATSDADDGIWMAMDPLPGLEGVTPEDPLPVAGIGALRSAGVTSIIRIDDAYTTPEIAVTLASADDVHYAATRRMLLWIRQSVQAAMISYVFAANDLDTWTSMTAMISNFLTGIWQEGGLEGGTAAEAFTAQCSAQPAMILLGYLQCDLRVDLVTGSWQSLSLLQVQSS